jgi:hypothetical protein
MHQPFYGGRLTLIPCFQGKHKELRILALGETDRADAKPIDFATFHPLLARGLRIVRSNFWAHPNVRDQIRQDTPNSRSI